MEIKFKCSKQEIERAIVACEGDLEQAVEALKVQKQEHPPVIGPKNDEETGAFSTLGNIKVLSTSKMISKAIPIHQKTDEKYLNYDCTKSAVTVGLTSTDPEIKSFQLLKKVPPNSDLTKQQQVCTPSVEMRWPVTVGRSNSSPSVSYPLASPIQAASAPASTEPRYTNLATELKNLQLGLVQEPVIVMQRSKSKIIPSSVSTPSSSSDWHPNVGDPLMNMNVNAKAKGFSHGPTTTRSFNSSNLGNMVNNAQLYDPFHHPQQQHQSPSHQQYASSSGPFDHFSHQGPMNQFNGGMWNRTAGSTTTPTLAAASSLGLFSGLGSNGPSGPSSPVDWNACDLLQFDYANIDWSLDRLPHPPSSPSRPNCM
ncbi:hypothetical protein R6Q57_006966 [Mikania cordata]